MSLIFLVPPGIGDFSAMYQKLCCVDRKITIRSSTDPPERLGAFLDILPAIHNGGYSSHNATLAVQQTLPPGTDIASLNDGIYMLAINSFLEEGGKVADWIPGPTEYHYPMLTPPIYMDPLRDFLGDTLWPGSLVVGVYCSAYGNSRHWGFWGTEEWRTFLELVRMVLPKDTQYVFIGAEYDVEIADYLAKWMSSTGYNAYDMLGAFHISATVELIRNLDYFFVFPSGLGFLADVVKTPNMMWFPHHLDPMRGTFCDPVQYESKQSLHCLFSSPEAAFNDFRSYGLRHLEERYAENHNQRVRK